MENGDFVKLSSSKICVWSIAWLNHKIKS
jgi:hypothetical protein